MSTNDKDIQKLMDKVKSFEKGQSLDLSSGEDLSIGIMNLISIEEHLFFSAGKTGDTKYYDLIQDIRKMRVSLLKKIIKDYGGEEWCISKHLLAASMRLMEVGTKAQTKGDTKEAYDLFQKSYDLYNLFWAINLGITDTKKESFDKLEKTIPQKEQPLPVKKDDFMGKIGNLVSKVLDCCRE